jgi:penicillin-binding protein 2
MKKINSNPLEIEEIFLDSLVKEKSEEPEVASRKIESPLDKRKFYIFSICGSVLVVFLLGVVFNLQIVHYKKYQALALNNKYLDLKIKAERGIIYDAEMTPLVSNEAKFDLWLDKDIKDSQLEEVLREVSGIIKIPQEQLRKIAKENFGEGGRDKVLLKQNLSHLELVLLESKIKELKGIEIKKQIKRDYVKEPSLSHVLGYLGKISPEELKQLDSDYGMEDFVGKEGLEKTYEKVLAEKKGVLEIERDAKGRIISERVKQNPCSGDNLVLSLNYSLEKVAADALRKAIKENKATGGAVIAVNPQNGEVLASVSLPSFDNNLFSKGITKEEFEKLNSDPSNPQLNRVIGGVYPVGSTIKPLIASAALEEGIITPNTKLFAPLKLCLENVYSGNLECYGDWKFHGETDVRRAIAESINPFFYMVGGGYKAPRNADPRLPRKFEGLGVSKIKKWLKLFGWGEKTGIDLPGEVKGRVPDPEWKEKYFSGYKREYQLWYRGDTYNLSIGQGYILITPLQVVTAFQAIANGKGVIFKPHLVREILKNSKECNSSAPERGEEVKQEIKKEILKKVPLKEEVITVVREGMRQAVSSPQGSAVMLSSLPERVAAKTGTAQTPKENVFHNWITAFGPYENPDILLTVVVENVKGTRIVAQKVAYEILNWWFTHRGKKDPRDKKDKEPPQ